VEVRVAIRRVVGAHPAAVRAEFHPAVRGIPAVEVLASRLAASPVLPVALAQKGHRQPQALRPFVQSFQVVSAWRVFLFVNSVSTLHQARTLSH